MRRPWFRDGGGRALREAIAPGAEMATIVVTVAPLIVAEDSELMVAV
jgi:hypothetical protein